MKRRPIESIIKTKTQHDIVFIQPHLLSDELKHEQNKIVTEFWATMHKHAVLLGDIPSEPNHGIYFIAGTLIKAGYNVEAIDFHAYDRYLRYKNERKIEISDIEEAIKNKEAKIFGISSKTVAIERGLKIAEVIRKYHPDSKIVFGGLHPTLEGENLLKENSELIDYIIQGEGEESSLELLNHINGKLPIESVKNLLYYNDEGVMVKNERRLVTDVDVDNLAYPAYELICNEASPIVPRVLSARGCPHGCAFCSITHYYDRKYKLRCPESVVDEIQYLHEKFNIDFYCLGDLTFSLNREYTHKICNLLIERNLHHIKWWCQTTIGRLNEKDLEIMKKSGCIQVAFGVEADDQQILDLVDKPMDASRTEKQCELVKAAGLTVQTYWLLGFGNDTKESIEKRIKLIKYYIESGLTDSIHVSVPVPFPGTPIWKEPEKYGYKINHKQFGKYWMNCDELGYGKPIVDTKYLTADHLYMYWLLALSTATEAFEIVGKKSENAFSHFQPKGLFIAEEGAIPAFS